MKKKALVEAMTEALASFFGSDEGSQLLVDIIDKVLWRKITMIDGKTEPGKQVEKEFETNILDQILFYLPQTEGALRGMQEDLSKHVGMINVLNKNMEKFIEIMESPSPLVEVGHEGSGMFVDAQRLPEGKVVELPKLNHDSAGQAPKSLVNLPPKRKR